MCVCVAFAILCFWLLRSIPNVYAVTLYGVYVIHSSSGKAALTAEIYKHNKMYSSQQRPLDSLQGILVSIATRGP